MPALPGMGHEFKGESGITMVIENSQSSPPPPAAVLTEAKASTPLRGREMKIRENKKERMKKKRDALMVAATLIAGMGFQSALNPPGGVWDDDKNSGGGKMSAGTSIMVHYYPEDYQLFMACNAVCFFASLRIVFLVVSGVPFVRKRILVWLLMIIMWITLTGMGLTYLVSMVIISPTKDDSEATSLRNKLPDISISLVCFGIRYVRGLVCFPLLHWFTLSVSSYSVCGTCEKLSYIASGSANIRGQSFAISTQKPLLLLILPPSLLVCVLFDVMCPSPVHYMMSL